VGASCPVDTPLPPGGQNPLAGVGGVVTGDLGWGLDRGGFPYESHAFARVKDSYLHSLNVLMDPRYNGTYDSSGVLVPTAGGGVVAYGSELIPGLPSIPQTTVFLFATIQKLSEGDLEAPRVYTGLLSASFGAFLSAYERKTCFFIDAGVFLSTFLDGGVLNLPGIVVIDAPAGLPLPPITSILNGGMILSTGPIRITGNIVHGTGADEPLTLVAGTGNVDVKDGVDRLEAGLVSLTGKVAFPAGPLEIDGEPDAPPTTTNLRRDQERDGVREWDDGN